MWQCQKCRTIYEDTETVCYVCKERAAKLKKRYAAPIDKAIIILFAVLPFLGGVLWLMLTTGISLSLAFWGFVIYFSGVAIFYRDSLRSKISKYLLRIFRTIGLSFMIIAYITPLVCLNFENTKALYPLKRIIYVKGVRPIASELLPDFLPENTTDYYFRIEVDSFAQDYHPYSYLIIHTDVQALTDYEKIISENQKYTRTQNTQTAYDQRKEIYTEKMQYMANCPEKLPQNVYEIMVENAEITDNLDNAIIYKGNDCSTWITNTGALLNYETGLLVIWK